MEKSPSPVYGARLELVYGLIAHRGFESLLLRQNSKISQVLEMPRTWVFLCPNLDFTRFAGDLRGNSSPVLNAHFPNIPFDFHEDHTKITHFAKRKITRKNVPETTHLRDLSDVELSLSS